MTTDVSHHSSHLTIIIIVAVVVVIIISMCHHKRFVFNCGHFSWGAEVLACNRQSDFAEGKVLLPCETMWSHPLHSLKVGTLCKDCDLKRRKTAGVMTKLKSALRELNETVARCQKVSGAE
jgi:hypothetical protein